MPNLWQRLVAGVNREYERRVRAASLVQEYGAHAAEAEQEADGEVAVIANVPRGTRLQRSAAVQQPDVAHNDAEPAEQGPAAS